MEKVRGELKNGKKAIRLWWDDSEKIINDKIFEEHGLQPEAAIRPLACAEAEAGLIQRTLREIFSINNLPARL